MTITISTRDKRSIGALAVLNTADKWHRGHRKEDGRSFFAVPSESQPGLFHLVDCRECTCQDFVRRQVACKHILAVRLRVAVLTGFGRRVPVPASDASPTGTIREVALSTCRTCGRAHSSEQERRQVHAAIASDVWGRDGE